MQWRATYCPVSRHARFGEQSGVAWIACVNDAPSLAKRSILGVLRYGCPPAPNSFYLRSSTTTRMMFGRTFRSVDPAPNAPPPSAAPATAPPISFIDVLRSTGVSSVSLRTTDAPGDGRRVRQPCVQSCIHIRNCSKPSAIRLSRSKYSSVHGRSRAATSFGFRRGWHGAED
jgi:hypothetical protein